MGIFCMSQETQTGALFQPRGVGWGGRWEGGSKGRGYMYPYGWFMLKFDRRQQNSVKQLSFNKKINLKKSWGQKKNLKSSKGKTIRYIQRNSLKTMSIFSAETLMARGSRMIIKVLKLKTKNTLPGKVVL